jgi:hypothetical protein
MAASTSAPIKRAIVQKLRATPAIVSAINGGIHETIAPRKVKYPFIVYDLIASPYDYLWGSVMLKPMFDVFVFAENPVEANNLDALIAGALNEAELSVDGQTTLLCRRVADTPTGPDVDAEGKRIYQIGATYSIWTDQSL